MTFTEAAIEVLRREGKPLHFKKISEIAIREGLLDHIGKIPEEIMSGQLSAHCRLPRGDRRVLPVQHGTFALTDWGLDEDLAGLENLIEAPPIDEPPYRARERHPIPSRDMARSVGRGEQRAPRRREEGEERRRRYPPPAEVAYEILAGAGKSLTLTEIAAQGAERLLMPDAFVRDMASLAAALHEDNRRRESSGRKALFALEGDNITLVAQPEPGEQPAQPVVTRAPATATEARKSGLASLRRRLRECDGATLELVVARMFEHTGVNELKVAKRSREHVVYTGRLRMGLGDVRHCIRILRTSADASRRDVSELRRDLGHYGAQIGVLVTPGEAGREARGEASTASQMPVLLLCGEALAEALAEASIGCRMVQVPEVDESYFKSAAEEAANDESARRARRDDRDRDRREPREGREGGREDREPRDAREGGREGREPREAREGGREGREPREGREGGREGREPREAREGGREGREPREAREGGREGREPREAREGGREGRAGREQRNGRDRSAPSSSAAATADPGASPFEGQPADDEDVPVSVIEGEASAAAATAFEPDSDSAGDDDDDEGDDEGGPEESAGAPVEAAREGEAPREGDAPRRRRRRRRRRGGRGRGERREPGAPGGPGEEGATPAGAAASSANGEASPQTARADGAAPPERPREDRGSGESGGGESGGGEGQD